MYVYSAFLCRLISTLVANSANQTFRKLVSKLYFVLKKKKKAAHFDKVAEY